MSSLVNDVHGTALAVVHNTKYTLTRNFADPFGGRRGEVLDTPGDRGFLGKVEDTTGLTSVGARYYDSGVGRFVSVDPVMDLGDPQQWSAYTYANNNPVTWSDPTGLLSWKGAWSSVKKGASAVGKWASKNKAEIIGGVVGTVVGVGCAALTVGWGSVACAVAGEALAGAITNTIRQSSSGKPFSWGSFATETVIGGVFGAVGLGVGAVASRWIAPVANRAVQGAASAARASISKGGQAIASAARGVVNKAKDSVAQVVRTKPIQASTPRPATNVQPAISPKTSTNASNGVAVAASTIRFSQRTVGSGVEEIESSMRASGWAGDAIDVVRMRDGGLTSVDNRRLLAAKRVGIEVQAVIHEFDDIIPAEHAVRFATKKGVLPNSWGEAVLNRIANQGAGYRSAWPNGSNLTGWAG